MTAKPTRARYAVPAVIALAIVGFLLRLAIGRQLPLWIDEAFSVLAINQTAHSGTPVLPSGVLYLHGATLSYLMAPLVALGWIQPLDYEAMRPISALAGAVAIVLIYLLARTVRLPEGAAVIAAALLALDPVTVQWGGYIRMYELQQVFTIGVALAFFHALSADNSGSAGQVTRWALPGLVVLFWMAVFTHLSAALLWPFMALAALLVYGRKLFSRYRPLLAALGAAALAPLTLVLLSSNLGPGAGTKIPGNTEGLPGVSFLGEDKIRFDQFIHPDPSVWTSLFGPGPLELIMPLLVTAASAAVFVLLFIPDFLPRSPTWSKALLGALLLLHWGPIVVFAMVSGPVADRYGLLLIPYGYVIVAAFLYALTVLPYADPRSRNAVIIGWSATAVLTAALLLHMVVGTIWLFQRVPKKSAMEPALEFLAQHREPTAPIALTIPPAMAKLVLGSTDGLVFLAGVEDSQRVLRYTRLTAAGERVDYWLGGPALGSTREVCSFLRQSPEGWLFITDSAWEQWGFVGGKDQRNSKIEEMQAIISAAGKSEFEDPDVRVFRILPEAQWKPGVDQLCPVAKSDNQRHKPDRNRDDRKHHGVTADSAS
ncbi:MAG: glycosyltransferase family 39 protein [Thermomicrobiales bacterium]